MGYFNSLDVSASALTAQRLRMDTISQNIANTNTTRTDKGTPYRRKTVVFEERKTFSDYMNNAADSAGEGVRVTKIAEDKSDFKKVYDPGNPDADKDGYVQMPNVEIVNEMIDMISATRSYEANVTAINGTKGMIAKALEIGK
jgi:flagellar basal-body rod protein FlgC